MDVNVRAERPVTREEYQTLMREEQVKVPSKTWRPTTGGILSIVTGYLNILTGLLLIVGYTSGFLTAFTVGLGTGFGGVLIVAGIISIIGGAYALGRRSWGMALAGSILALFPSFSIIPGTLSLILVALGKPEFGKQPHR